MGALWGHYGGICYKCYGGTTPKITTVASSGVLYFNLGDSPPLNREDVKIFLFFSVRIIIL